MGGKGKGKHHGHWGAGPAVVAAEVVGAAVVGGIAGAAIATAVVHPRPKPHPRPYPVARGPVVVVAASPSPQAPVVVVAARPAPKWKGKGKGWGKGKGKGTHFAPVVVVQPPVQTFASVSVPAGAAETRGDTHYFGIDVLPAAGGGPWRVMRRYNEFHDLYDKIGKHAYPDAPFPGKHMFGIGLNMEDRRRGLEVWLQRTVQHPNSRAAWARPLSDFLTAGKESVQPAVAVASPVPAAPAAPYVASAAPSAPLPAPSAPPPGETEAASAAEPAPEEDDGSELMVIEIPPGVASGAVLGITVPDGSQVNVTLPDGKNSGDALELWYDASAGTLTPLA